MIKFTPFTADDWLGLLGCERFADGAEPRSGTLKYLSGEEALVVLDAHGITVMGLGGDEGEWRFNLRLPVQAVEDVAQILLTDVANEQQLKDIGFR